MMRTTQFCNEVINISIGESNYFDIITSYNPV